MDEQEYQASYELEDEYWWFRGQRETVLDLLRRCSIPAAPQILDAGCGTGKNLQISLKELGKNSVGFDFSPHAMTYLRRRGLAGRVCQASVNGIPFPTGTFDVALCLGVLDLAEVDEPRAWEELWRVVKPGGLIVLVLTAHRWLMSAHDQPIHTVRRYGREDVRRLVNRRPARILRLTHLYPSLFLPIAAVRIARRWMSSKDRKATRSDLRPLPSPVNKALYGIVSLERILVRKMDFPFGSSILAIAQKI
jgi:SAM-dependent methyltransferase